MSKLINVGIAEYLTAASPSVLRTILGSCVGICMYDKIRLVGGLAHIMLPEKNRIGAQDGKFANTAIPILYNQLLDLGATSYSIEAKIIGGASMFKVLPDSKMASIGKNNIIKTKEVLSNLNIKLVAEEVGGDFGRTLDFFIETGAIKIRSLGKEEKVI